MILKSPSIQIKMASLGTWCLEGTPGILEVYNIVDSPTEDQSNDSNHKRAEVATKLLETLENFNYDETAPAESYISDWLPNEETSVELPSIFEDFASQVVPPVAAAAAGPGGFYNTRPNTGVTAGNTKIGYEWSVLADEYSTSLYSPPAAVPSQWPQYDARGVPNQLTPPCTPPTMYEASPRGPSPVEFEDLAEDLLKPAPAKEEFLLNLLSEMNPKDIDDFVVRSAEENFGINDGYPSCEDKRFIHSPEHSSSDSYGYHSESDHSSSDPDYNPYSPEVSRKTDKISTEATAAATKCKSSRVSSARASKPYSRKPAVPIEDKKLRKKEQNKNAATRYRIKKKAEIEEILGEESELKEKNEALKAKVEDLNREVRFMKKFMRDFFKTRGLLK